MKLKRTLSALATSAMIALSATIAQAQSFPDKPITLIVPFTAGGGSDAVGRKVAERMSENLGQQVIVENKPGAATMIAADYVKAAPADGYTLLFASNTTLCVVPFAYKNARFTAEDFTPVSGVIDYSFAIVARKDAPFDDMKGFVEHAKANPNSVTFGTTGRGGSVHMLQMLMNKRLGIQTKDVPYQGGAPGLQDILGGRLDIYADGILPIIQHHKAGNVKVIAVSGKDRADAIGDVPTFGEQGFDALTTVYWFDMVAPKGTPDDVIQRLNEAVKFALEDKGVQEWMAASGYQTAYSTPQDEAGKIEADIRKWSALVKEFEVSLE